MTTETRLPEGCTVRPATKDDAQAMLEIYHAVSLHYTGEIEETLEEIHEAFDEPFMNPQLDTRVVYDANGRLVGFGWVTFRVPQDVDIDLYTPPDTWATDTAVIDYLCAWADDRAHDALKRLPENERVTLTAWCYAQDDWYRAKLEQIGLKRVRSSYQMWIDFDGAVAPAPFPEGVTVRTVTQDEDWHRVYAARREAWHDMWGYIPRTYEEDYADWLLYWKNNFHEDYWFIAEKDDLVIALTLCTPTYNGADDIAYVATVGVRRAYRKQGLGLALLRHALGRLQERGKRAAALYVDASSLTGAVALYERAGMHVKQRYDRMQKELRAGDDQRIHALD